MEVKREGFTGFLKPASQLLVFYKLLILMEMDGCPQEYILWGVI